MSIVPKLSPISSTADLLFVILYQNLTHDCHFLCFLLWIWIKTTHLMQLLDLGNEEVVVVMCNLFIVKVIMGDLW